MDMNTARKALNLQEQLDHLRRRRWVVENCAELRAIVETEQEWDEIDIEITDDMRAALLAKVEAEIAETDAAIRALGYEPEAEEAEDEEQEERGMSEAKQIEAAAVTVHWPTGPVNVCIDHATKLKALAQFLGTHVGITPHSSVKADGDFEQCINCVNEAKKR